MTRPVRTVHHGDSGLCQVTWYPDNGRPDTFLVARDEHTDPRWLSLADVFVMRCRPTVADADDLADAILLRLTGCGLVAVPVFARGYRLCARNGDRALVGCHCPDAAGAVTWAVFGYTALVSGGTLGDPASWQGHRPIRVEPLSRRNWSGGAR